MMKNQVSCELGDRLLTIETGHLARQANGSVVVHYGETVVLVTATASREKREDIDFFPLTVDYQEKYYSAGKIPGGFFKREGRPSTKATLSSRLIDRPLRPSFESGYANDTHIVATVLSVDQKSDPEIAALIGASAALEISNIPFKGPLAGVIIGHVNGEFVVNPTSEQKKNSQMHIFVVANRDAILMVEGKASEISEAMLVEALMLAHKSIQPILDIQDELAEKVGQPKMKFEKLEVDSALKEKIKKQGLSLIQKAVHVAAKHERQEAIASTHKKLLDDFSQNLEGHVLSHLKNNFGLAYSEVVDEYIRSEMLKTKKRIGGRGFEEIRDITCEVGVLPRTHGSSVFTRGETQALVTVTLGTSDDEQIIDSLEGESSQTFMLHYNFPPFATGEVGFLRGPGRREIGHGQLAQVALEGVIPGPEQCPYTLRVVSEILESNGSSSMASVCGASLALMDAGISIKAPVAGIAMGLIKEKDEIAILSDILGDEDHFGDMDFKVAGTAKGITAVQMDIKIAGISKEIMEKALDQAKAGRLFILEKMRNIIDVPRKELSKHAPRIEVIYVKPDKIGAVIGKGGSTIKKIIEETGAKVDISDDGKVCIISNDPQAQARAKKIIEGLTEEVEVGKIYKGRVAKIVDFGAFVDILPQVSGLVHISELDHYRVNQVSDIVKVGDEVEVKVIKITPEGKVNLSRKALLKKPQVQEQ
ncbi:MAG: polyribonucleotide nucleotidyltransferase [Deltaproteobacteria bacterium]|nr:polyribonucleotide nucleotidyltransferase [Deltaproteobacteria bacterium]